MGVLYEPQCSERATHFLEGSGHSIAWLSAAGYPVGRRIKYRRNSVARRAVEAVVFRARLARA